MTTTTLDRPRPQPVRSQRSRVVDLLRSELVKLRSVRSTYWTVIAAALVSLTADVLLCVHYAGSFDSLPASERLSFDPTATSLSGVFFAQIAIGTLGVLAMTSEYGTGLIRMTMAAVPQRRTLLAAKAATFAAVAFVVGEILSFTSFFVGQAILASGHIGASLGDPGVLRAVIGGGGYLTMVGLLGVGVGALLRRTAGALSMLFGLLFAAMIVVSLLPQSWNEHIAKYLPANAGSRIMFLTPQSDMLGPWTGFGVLALYAVAALGAATYLIHRRDV
jgi:ABC-2 type transport system permease protein